MPFDQFMATALYEPGLGYYTSPRTTFGRMPDGRTTAAGAAQPGVMPAPLSAQTRADAASPATAAVGSDFVTAPELSPLFGQTLARQVVQALQATGTREVWEFGAGSGALSLQILKRVAQWEQEQDAKIIEKYTIVDLSGTLRERQQARWSNSAAGCSGPTACPSTCRAWCWATRCWMPCP